MAERVIRIILTGDSKGAVRAFSEAGDAAQVTEDRLTRMHRAGQKISSVGSTMTAFAVPLVAVGGYAVKTAVDFQKAMELIRTQAGQSQREVNRMSTAVLNLAPKVGYGPNQLAQALYHLESSGYHGSKALSALTVAAEGAQIGGANLTDVTNALTGALVGGLKGTGNLRQAMGALNATVGAGDMHMQDLADSLSTGLLGPMKTYGVSLRDVGAALAVFGDDQIRGQEAATKLASAIRIMAAPSTAAAKALGSIGLTQTQLATDMRGRGGLIRAFQDLKRHLEDSGMTAVQQGLVITRAFGGRQAQGVELLLSQLPRLEAKYAAVGAGMGSFGSDLSATRHTTAFKWAQMRAALDVSLVKLGLALEPIVNRWLPRLTNAVVAVIDWFTHLPKILQQIAVWGTAFLAVGGPLLIFTGKLMSAITDVVSVVKALKNGLGSLLGAVGRDAAGADADAAAEDTAAGAAGAGDAAAAGGAAAGAGDAAAAAGGAGAAAGIAGTVGLLAIPAAYAYLLNKYGGPATKAAQQMAASNAAGHKPALYGSRGVSDGNNMTGRQNDSTSASTRRAGKQDLAVHIQNRIGARVMSEEVVHFAQKKSALSGIYVSG